MLAFTLETLLKNPPLLLKLFGREFLLRTTLYLKFMFSSIFPHIPWAHEGHFGDGMSDEIW